jgi:acetolactate synthase I/II/III large subunit
LVVDILGSSTPISNKMIGMRGADQIARALEHAGARVVFTVSGNHVMSVFDALLETGIRLIHARHEAAAVHMADAWARLTGECGFALVTGGPGHSNAVSGLYTAQAAEAPVVLLSGHAPVSELGRGTFQEMRQAELAQPLTKMSWTAQADISLEWQLLEAIAIAKSGRPGPVHLSLPVDLLEFDGAEHKPARGPAVSNPDIDLSAALLERLSASERPIILAGPLLCQPAAGDVLPRLDAALGVPVVAMESPRGLNDPALGAFRHVLERADLLVLLGKTHDFTLRFAEPPFVDPACKFVVIDPDPAMIGRILREKGDRVRFSAVADPRRAAEGLGAQSRPAPGKLEWHTEVTKAVNYRPVDWDDASSRTPGKLHPIELCRAVNAAIASRLDAVLICDGGEIGQWAQSLVRCPRRIINGVAGSIGAAVPFAIGVAAAEPGRPVVAISGDGAFGFHMAEFDTAVRYRLPFVAVIGNDAAWNAEHQIQLRTYGTQRAHSCQLLPSRYDQAVAALGAYGEIVTSAEELPGALDRAFGCAGPACINVMIEQVPAPVIDI